MCVKRRAYLKRTDPQRRTSHRNQTEKQRHLRKVKAKSTLRSSRHRTDWKRNGPWFCFSVDTDAPDVKPDVPQDTSNSSSHCSASRYSAVGDLVIAVFFRFLIRFSFDFLAFPGGKSVSDCTFRSHGTSAHENLIRFTPSSAPTTRVRRLRESRGGQWARAREASVRRGLWRCCVGSGVGNFETRLSGW